MTIADDYMFKLVMSHKRICKHLLEMILGIKIRKLMNPKTEHAISTGYESKSMRLDGLPVKDNWVDKLKDLIAKLKQDEREKVKYMTYQMKIDEEREEAKAEERKSGIRTLIITLKELSVDQTKVVEQLMKNYSLTHDKAQAAVQANW